MKCCPCCFGDKFLLKVIFPEISSDRGHCSYCGSADVLLIEPFKLKEVFAPLILIYEPVAEGGALLVEWMRHDWGLFNHPKIDYPAARSLLADILDDGEIVRK